MDDKKDQLLKFREFAALNLKDCVCKRTGQPYIQSLDFLAETYVGQDLFNTEVAAVYFTEIFVKKPELLSEIREKFGDEIADITKKYAYELREFSYNDFLQDYCVIEVVGFVNKDDFVEPKLQIFDVVQYETCKKCGKDVDKSLHFCKK